MVSMCSILIFAAADGMGANPYSPLAFVKNITYLLRLRNLSPN